jgi:hypothetical protein
MMADSSAALGSKISGNPREEVKKHWSQARPKGQGVSPSVEKLHESILDVVSTLRHRDAELLRLFRRMEEVRGYEAFGCYSMVDYVALLLGVDDLAARERVRVARSLGALPRLEAALHQGRLSYAKVRAVTRVATAETELKWLESALRLSAQQLEWEVARSRRGGFRPRKLWMKPVDAQTTRMIVELPAEEMELISQALDRVRKDGNGFVSSPEALVYLAAEALSADPSESGSSSPFQVVVHLDMDTVPRSGPESGTVTAVTVPKSEDSGAGDESWQQPGSVNTSCGKAQIPPHRVEQMLCDGAVIIARHLEDGSLEMSDRARTIPVATRRAILARDGGRCQVPGCNNKLWLDVHHCKPWWAGGEHTQANLLTLCRHHHSAVHEGRIQVRPPDEPGGRPRFFVGSWEMKSELVRADLRKPQ